MPDRIGPIPRPRPDRDLLAVTIRLDASRMQTTTPLPPCPACGSLRAIEVVYGLPAPELTEAALRGEVRLGGCLIGPESPDYECLDCGRPLPWVMPNDDDAWDDDAQD